MKGSVRVVVSTKKLRYELNLRRNITILQGDSAWERFFTCLLDNLTRNTIYAYSKKKLNPNYLTRGNIDKMEKRMLVTGLFD